MHTIGAVQSGNGDVMVVDERCKIIFNGIQRIDMRSN